MSDDAAARFEQAKPPASPPEARSYTLSITLQPNGELEVSGPIGNKVLSFGLLGAAHSHLTNYHLKAEAAQAQASRGGIAGIMKRMNGGT